MNTCVVPTAATDVVSGQPRAVGVTTSLYQPQWIGTETRYLYAALHQPAMAGARCGILLVPPLLHEQPRSRRLLTEVANAFAGMGLPCLRFDFFGTGDSAGEGEDLDFASMHSDLRLASQALHACSGVERIVVLAWRAAALPVYSWIRQDASSALVVLWEPVADGQAWMAELEHDDAVERRSPKRYPMTRGAGVVDDDQLMGYRVSAQFRHDIVRTRLVEEMFGSSTRYWAVLRPDAQPLPITLERTFTLPADTPTIGGAPSMSAALFVSPRLKEVVDALGQALREEG